MTLFSEIYEVMFASESRDHYFNLLNEVYRMLIQIKIRTIREGSGRKCDLLFDERDILTVIDFLMGYTDIRA